jgi:hypothetical protein
MTIKQFAGATHFVQKTMVKFHGIPLLRQQKDTCSTILYQLYSFYVEVECADRATSESQIRWYTVEQIDTYLNQIDLSAIEDLLN